MNTHTGSIEHYQHNRQLHPWGEEVHHDDVAFQLLSLSMRLIEQHETAPPHEPSQLDRLRAVVAMYHGSIDPNVDETSAVLLARDTNHGLRQYDLSCTSMLDPDTGDIIFVRKDNMFSSEDPADWIVARYNIFSNELHEDVVVTASTEHQENGDHIELELLPTHPYRGGSVMHFLLNGSYTRSGGVTLGYYPYYGRSTGPNRTFIVQTEYLSQIDVLERYLSPDKEIGFRIDLSEKCRDLGSIAVGL